MSAPKHKSPYSPAAIGCRDEGINIIRQKFKEESGIVLDYLKSTHHARKAHHLQVHYPETVTSLLKSEKNPKPLMTLDNQYAKKLEQKDNIDNVKYKEFMNTLQTNIHGEHDLNHKKRAFNRSNGSKAAISDILQGTGKVEKEYLFPNKITHNQVLAMTGTLSMPDAHTIPPEIPKAKKWLGDDKGWQ